MEKKKKNQRVDRPCVCERDFKCFVCKDKVKRGSSAWSIATNGAGYSLVVHSACLSLFNASCKSRKLVL